MHERVQVVAADFTCVQLLPVQFRDKCIITKQSLPSVQKIHVRCVASEQDALVGHAPM